MLILMPLLEISSFRCDRRLPLYRRLHFHEASDVPALAADRAAGALGDIKRAVIEAMRDYAAELDGLPWQQAMRKAGYPDCYHPPETSSAR
jgi:hypothetical protein